MFIYWAKELRIKSLGHKDTPGKDSKKKKNGTVEGRSAKLRKIIWKAKEFKCSGIEKMLESFKLGECCTI